MEEVEKPYCDSDAEESVSSWALRRAEASDEDDENGGGKEEAAVVRTGRRGGSGFGDDLDGLGGAPEEEKENDEYDEEGLSDDVDELDAFDREDEEALLEEEEGAGFDAEDERVAKEKEEEEEKKKKQTEKDALTDPVLGAFYMHDDRFRRRRGGRLWQTAGKRNLKKSQDERKWRHDKFEEMAIQESNAKKFNAYNKVWRTSDSHHHGYYENQGRGYTKANQLITNVELENQSLHSRIVRGRGPIKYRPLEYSSNVNLPVRNRRSSNPPGMMSNTGPLRASSHPSNVDFDFRASEKQVSVSAGKSRLHAHYGASSSNREISATKKREEQPRRTYENFPTAASTGDNTNTPHSNTFARQKTSADSMRKGGLTTKEMINPVPEHHTNLPLWPSVTQPAYTAESPQLRAQGRDLLFSVLNPHQSTTPSTRLDMVSPVVQNHAVQQMPIGSVVRPPLQIHNPQLSSQSVISSETLLSRVSELGLMGSGTSEFSWAEKGNSTVQDCGRASLYGGTRVPQHTTGSTQLFPVIGQHDTAFNWVPAGLMSQHQAGFGTSGMNWLAFLANGGGATNCPPYLTQNGGYYAHSVGQMSSVVVPSNEAGTGLTVNGTMPPVGTAQVARNEWGPGGTGPQGVRPQRYSKMNFDDPSQ